MALLQAESYFEQPSGPLVSDVSRLECDIVPQACEFSTKSEQAVRVMLDRQVREGNLPGASVLIRQRGRDVLYRTSGLSDF